MTDTFYTTDEFAKEIRVCSKTVRKMIKTNKIKAVKLSKGNRSRWLIPKTELQRIHAQAYLEE